MDESHPYDDDVQAECKCTPLSPFLWRLREGPSIFYEDRSNRPKGEDGLSMSLVSTLVIEGQRAAGGNPGYLKGIGKNREVEALRVKDFHVYSKVKK
jgi:hypothetical protein